MDTCKALGYVVITFITRIFAEKTRHKNYTLTRESMIHVINHKPIGTCIAYYSEHARYQ